MKKMALGVDSFYYHYSREIIKIYKDGMICSFFCPEMQKLFFEALIKKGKQQLARIRGK